MEKNSIHFPALDRINQENQSRRIEDLESQVATQAEAIRQLKWQIESVQAQADRLAREVGFDPRSY